MILIAKTNKKGDPGGDTWAFAVGGDSRLEKSMNGSNECFADGRFGEEVSTVANRVATGEDCVNLNRPLYPVCSLENGNTDGGEYLQLISRAKNDQFYDEQGQVDFPNIELAIRPELGRPIVIGVTEP